jgi:hypothetical protein
LIDLPQKNTQGGVRELLVMWYWDDASFGGFGENDGEWHLIMLYLARFHALVDHT